MIVYFLFTILFVCIHGELNLCQGSHATSNPVIDYCTLHNGILEYRCCYVLNSTNVVAIDLIDMKFDQVPDLKEYLNLTVIDLRSNSKLKPSKRNDFLALKSLDYLLLPEQYSCPGDKHVWQVIDLISNPKGIVCQHQKDICTNSSDMCISPNSDCFPNGPNHFLCLCKEGYYGYKCLRHGRFPAGKVFGTTIGITFLLGTFFYLTHRRNVKKD